MDQKNVILIEDRKDDADLFLRSFSRMGLSCNLVVLNDGEQALEYIFGKGQYAGRDTGVLPNLIVLDLKISKVSGMEVLKAIRDCETTKLIPVVVFSSSSEPQDIMNSHALRANSYVCKSVDFESFSEEVRKIMNYWLLLNQPPCNPTS